MDNISIWRKTVFPGESTYIWSRGGHLPTGNAFVYAAGNKTYTLDDSIPLKPFLWGDTIDLTDPKYSTGLTIPENTPACTYHLHINGQDASIPITVAVRPQPRQVATITPSGDGDSANIQAALNSGKDISLSPGVFVIDSTISIPAGAAVRGAHRDVSILKRLPKEGEYKNRIFTSMGGNVSLSDFAVEGSFAPGAALLHNNLPGEQNQGLTIQRLRLTLAGSIQLDAPGAFVEDVEFKRSGGCIGGNHQLWKDIRFEGRCPFDHESIVMGEQLAMFNISWRDTGRGMVLRGGPQNSFFSRLVFDGIQYGNNGDEIILAEDLGGPGLRNGIFFHIRVRNCSGAAIEFWDTNAIDNYFRGMNVNGGFGIMMREGKAGARQTGNVFQDVELRGCVGIHLGGAVGNTFKGLAIISPRPSWANQEYFDPVFYPAISSAIVGSKGNVFNPVIFVDLPVGWKPMD